MGYTGSQSAVLEASSGRLDSGVEESQRQFPANAVQTTFHAKICEDIAWMTIPKIQVHMMQQLRLLVRITTNETYKRGLEVINLSWTKSMRK